MADKKWKPEEWENYYTINGIMQIYLLTNNGLGGHKLRINSGNCFRTKKEAQQKLKLIKQILKG